MSHPRLCSSLVFLFLVSACAACAQEDESASAGSSAANMSCAELYVAQKYESAAIRCIAESVLGNAEGQTILGLMYLLGKGVPQDEAKAVEQFQLAAKQGQPDAQFALGRMYEQGRGGLPRDVDAALQWYRAAANQGHEQAAASWKKLLTEDDESDPETTQTSAATPAQIECSPSTGGATVCDYRGLFRFTPPANSSVSVDGSRVVARVKSYEVSVELIKTTADPDHFVAEWLENLRQTEPGADLSKTVEREMVSRGLPTIGLQYCSRVTRSGPRIHHVFMNPMHGEALLRIVSEPANPGCEGPVDTQGSWGEMVKSLDDLEFIPAFKHRLGAEASLGFLQRAAKDVTGEWVVSRSVGVRVHEEPEMQVTQKELRDGVPALILENASGGFVIARWPLSMSPAQIGNEAIGKAFGYGCEGVDCRVVERVKETFLGQPAERIEMVELTSRRTIIVTANTHHTITVVKQGTAKRTDLEERFEFVD